MPIDEAFNQPPLLDTIDRPHWGPKQVRKLSVKPGHIYEVLVTDPSHERVIGRSLLLALSKPAQNDKGDWWFECTCWPEPYRLEGEFCSGLSIVPHPATDRWNNIRVLLRTRIRSRTEEELADIRAQLKR